MCEILDMMESRASRILSILKYFLELKLCSLKMMKGLLIMCQMCFIQHVVVAQKAQFLNEKVYSFLCQAHFISTV